VAHHEAGHVVVMLDLGLAIRCASIEATEDSAGRVTGYLIRRDLDALSYRSEGVGDRARAWAEKHILALVAGSVGEALHARASPQRVFAASTSSQDRECAVWLAGLFLSDGEVQPYFAWILSRAAMLLRRPVGRVRHRALVRALLRDGSLSGARVRAVCEAAVRSAVPRLRPRD
jgi:hypothetical protein